jgi:hypothetical protein
MAPDIATRVAIICVVSVFLCVSAVAQEGYYGVGHDRKMGCRGRTRFG